MELAVSPLTPLRPAGPAVKEAPENILKWKRFDKFATFIFGSFEFILCSYFDKKKTNIRASFLHGTYPSFLKMF